MKLNDPAFIFGLGVVVSIEQAVSGGVIHLTHMVPDDWIPVITAWCSFLAFVGTALMTALSGYSSNKSGPLSPISTEVKATTAAIILLLILLVPSPSYAATPPLPQPRPLNLLNLGNKPATPTTPVTTPRGSPLEKLMSDLASIKAELVQGIIDDLTAADADAATLDPQTQQMRDPIAHACYPAQIKFLQGLPTAAPLAGKYVAVQLHQRLRDFVIQVKAGLPTYLKLGCAPMIGDDLQIIVQTLGLVGVTVGSTIFSGGLSLPALPLLPVP